MITELIIIIFHLSIVQKVIILICHTWVMMKKLECRRFPQVSYICIELHLIAIFFSSSSLSLRVQVLVLVKLIKAKSHTLIVKFLFFSSFFLSISWHVLGILVDVWRIHLLAIHKTAHGSTDHHRKINILCSENSCWVKKVIKK